MKRLLLVGLLLAACAPAPSSTTQITVSAASSLTEAFTEIGEEFTAADVTFNFAASSVLVQQLQEGAKADVIATADMATIERVGSLIESPKIFASNRLAIVVAKGNPKAIRSVADLANPDLVVVLCAPQVPCGRLADRALANARVSVTAASREENVKAVLSKVTLDEADAGIVYMSDVQPEVVEGVPIPDLIASYPIAAIAPASKAAKAFVDFVLSGPGQAILAKHGFLPA